MSKDWSFGEGVEKEFYNHVRKHVPHYEIIQSLVSGISEWFLEDGTNVYDLGSSLGDTIKNIKEVNPSRDAKYIGYDKETGMVDEALKTLCGDEEIYFQLMDITSNDFSPNNASVISSILTMMFIPKKERDEVVRKVFQGLNDGGVFLWVEKTTSEFSIINEVNSGIYDDLKISNGVAIEDLYNKAQSLRGVLKPDKDFELFKRLKRAGFSEYGEFFRWGSFIGIMAVK